MYVEFREDDNYEFLAATHIQLKTLEKCDKIKHLVKTPTQEWSLCTFTIKC